MVVAGGIARVTKDARSGTYRVGNDGGSYKRRPGEHYELDGRLWKSGFQLVPRSSRSEK